MTSQPLFGAHWKSENRALEMQEMAMFVPEFDQQDEIRFSQKFVFLPNLSKYQLKLGTKICVTCSLNIQNLLLDTFLTLSEWYLYNK